MDNIVEKDNTPDDAREDGLKRYKILNTPRLAIEAANVGIWFFDVETKVFITSPRLKELYGYHPDEEMSYDASFAQITDKYKKRVENAIQATLTNREQCNIEYSIIGFHDKKVRWVKALGALATDDKGKIAHFSGVMIDITQQRRIEKSKFKFIGVVSHELKTPLTTLKAYVQMLSSWAKKQKDSFTIGTLSKVEKQITKMTTMINSFLNISQVELGKMRLNLQEFDIVELLKDAIDETRIVTLSHTINFLPAGSLIIKADKDKVEQVLINLINNASKYSPEGTDIDIGCECVGDTVQISVKDRGIGVEKENIDKLFDQYFRVESNETQTISGFGIGLYLSAEIIRLHHGKIWVESEFGAGSTFYFSLPLNQE